MKVGEKGFDATRSSGLPDCLADSNNAICRYTAGQSRFQIAHQASLANAGRGRIQFKVIGADYNQFRHLQQLCCHAVQRYAAVDLIEGRS